MIRTAVPIPVVWMNANPEGSNRGYWDQAMLQEIFDGTEATVAAEYQQFEGFADWNLAGRPTGGAIVIIQGQSNSGFADEARRQIKTAQLEWMLFIVTSDEMRQFPTHQFNGLGPRTNIWQQTPNDEDHRAALADEVFPFGYRTGTRDILREIGPIVHSMRAADFVLMGQNTHIRRRQCFEALRNQEVVRIEVETEGFAQGAPQDAYLECMANGRVAPAPAGNVSVDSFRIWEALEAGCTPLVDGLDRNGYPRTTYWDSTVGGIFQGRLYVNNWVESIANAPLDQATANASQVSWQNWKREFAERLANDAHWLSEAPKIATPADDITVIMPTSPIPSHPDPAIILETIASVRERLPLARIVVLADGVRPEQEDRRQDYEEYLAQLLWHCNFTLQNVEVRVSSEWRHQALLVRDFLDLEKVRGVPDGVILFVEHDTPLVGEIPFDRLARHVAVTNRTVRFYFEDELHPAHAAMVYNAYPLTLPPGYRPMAYEGALEGEMVRDLLETTQWSQRPHLSTSAYYRRILHDHFPDDCRTMIEDRMHSVVIEWAKRELKVNPAGEPPHWIEIYAPPGGIKRSGHLDGRCTDPKGLGIDPKFDMNYGSRS